MAEEAAREQADKVGPALDRWFARVSLHDRLRRAAVEVELSRQGGRLRNVYRLRACDEEGAWRAGPATGLSGGYETLLGVAALCALAEVEADHSLDLLVLDEPTQSLDPELARRLTETLALHLPAGRTVVTTADPAFAEALLARAQGRAQLVRLAPWTAAAGSRLEAP